MASEGNTAAGGSSSLSLRSSCDRCRIQKLKCFVQAGSSTCQRCSRAKVQCVFGRRTRSKRSQRDATASGLDQAPPSQLPSSPPTTTTTTNNSNNNNNNNNNNNTTATTTTPAPPTCALSTAEAAPTTSITALSAELGPTPDSRLLQLPDIDASQASFDAYQASWDDLALALHDSDPITEFGSDMASYGWFVAPSELTLADVTQSRNGGSQPETPPWTGHQATGTNTAAPGCSPIGSSLLTPPSGGRHGSPPSCSAGLHGTSTADQQLTALVSEMQEQLSSLEAGPWHTITGTASASTTGLHDYPVGNILRLSQQFSSIAGRTLSGTASYTGGGRLARQEQHGQDDADIDDSNKSGASSAGTGAPTMLLVVCGYMWLVRIYHVALGHFQQYLNGMPATSQDALLAVNSTMMNGSPQSPYSSSRSSISISKSRMAYSTMASLLGSSRHHTTSSSATNTNTAPASPALRLGELPCEDSALDLQQIHTAVRMLLGALDDVEAHLGQEAGVARDMAVAMLLNAGWRRQDGSSAGLGMKATAIKKLLREQMGL